MRSNVCSYSLSTSWPALLHWMDVMVSFRPGHFAPRNQIPIVQLSLAITLT
jgi:hypothetical protein